MTTTAASQPTDTPPSAGERVAQLLGVVERLTAIIADENRHLESRQPSLLAETEAEKGRLAAVYGRQLQEIGANPALVKLADASDKNRLKAAVRNLEDLLATHARMLVTMKAVTEGMVRTVAEEVQKRRAPLAGYGRNAAAPAAASAYGGLGPASLAVNQTI